MMKVIELKNRVMIYMNPERYVIHFDDEFKYIF